MLQNLSVVLHPYIPMLEGEVHNLSPTELTSLSTALNESGPKSFATNHARLLIKAARSAISNLLQGSDDIGPIGLPPVLDQMVLVW